MDSYRNMAVSQSKSDLKRQMKRFAGMKLRNLNDPNAGEPDHVTFIRNGKLTLSMAKINNENLINRQMITSKLQPLPPYKGKLKNQKENHGVWNPAKVTLMLIGRGN